MSSKRQATSDLNHDNWDKEEEPEERGHFRQASEDQLKNRVIRKATRRMTSTADGDDGNAPKSAFSGFSGFGKGSSFTTTTTGASPFSFLSNLAGASSTALASSSNAPPKTTFSFGSPASTIATSIPTTTTQSTSATTSIKSDSTGGDKSKNNNYNTKIVALNKAVSEWVKTHVDKNPLCILTPIFDDYAKHLKALKEQDKIHSSLSVTNTASPNKPSTATETSSAGAFKFTSTASATKTTSLFGSTSTTTSASASTTSASTTPPSTSIFGNVGKPITATETATKTNGFSFGLSTQQDKTPATVTSSENSAGSFVFGKPEMVDDKKPAGFSFAASSTPFSFGNIKPPQPSAVTDDNKGNEDEDDEPPKVEFTQVVEEDAVFSKKCKVFVKKDGSFKDRGVGTLYLKPVKDSAKAQLLVRADTNLGNILVNLILNEGLPVQRMGKNNVMLVCLPTPDMDKPTSMLLRVKTGDEADELLKWIEKYKK